MLTSIRRDSDDDDDFDLDGLTPRPPWGLISMLLVSLFLFVPVGLALHLCALDWGARFYRPSTIVRLVEGFLLTVIVVQLVASWPLSVFIYPELAERRRVGFAGFCLACLMFFAPPLAAFVCFIGDAHDLMDGYEVFLIVFPALTIGLTLYWRTQKTWIMTLFVTVALFIPLYLMNDLLSPFQVLIAYASKGSAFYWWRSLFPITAAAFALASPQTSRFSIRNFRRESGFIILGILASVVILRVVIPIGIALHAGMLWNAYLEWDLSWLLYLPMLAFVLRPSQVRYWMMLVACGLGAVSSVAHLAMRPWQGAPDFWRLASFSQELLVAALLIQLAYQLSKPAFRSVFSLSSGPGLRAKRV